MMKKTQRQNRMGRSSLMPDEDGKQNDSGAHEGGPREVVIRVHPEMAHHLESTQRDGLERLQALIGRKVSVQGVPAYHREQYELTFK